MLVEEHPVSYAPSLNSLAFLRQMNRAAERFRLLAVGAPVVEGRPADSSRSVGIDVIGLLEPLPYSREEVNSIRRHFLWQSRVLADRYADEQRMMNDDLSACRVLRFATHGLVNESQPNRSGLLLSAARLCT